MQLKCPCGSPWHVMEAPLRGGYCMACGKFDLEKYDENWHLVYFLVFNFIHRFMRRNLSESGLDYLTNKIASEIWLYNMSQTLQIHRYADIASDLADETSRSNVLKKCNAYSIAQYLGIPHQTVRRKINHLIERGWVIRSPEGLLSISASCEAEFKPEFNLETMRDFVSTAKGVFAMLGCLDSPANQD